MQFALRGRWLAAAATLAAGTAGAARPAAAQSVTLTTFLNGAQEVPATTSAATGFGSLTYNQALGTISIALRVSGLGSNTVPVGAGGGPGHVHLGAPGVNGAIVIPVTNAPVGATSFDVTQSYTFASLLAIGISPANVTALTTELNRLVATGVGTQANLYFNVHTVNFGGGEIRGNLTVAPEPGTVALVAAGLAGVGAAARRRRGAARANA